MKEYIKYLPEFLRDFKEINAIDKAENAVLNDEWGRFNSIEKNQWIKTADDEGLKRFENMLGISGGGNSLDVRRSALLVKYNNDFIYTYYMFKNYLNNICGEGNYDFEVVYDKYTVNINLGLSVKFLYNIVENYARYIIPANMAINIQLKYNKHITLRPITHQKLASYTHSSIRNTEIA